MRHIVQITEIPHKYLSGRGTDSSQGGGGGGVALSALPCARSKSSSGDVHPSVGLGFRCNAEKVVLAFSRAAFQLLEGISALSHPSA